MFIELNYRSGKAAYIQIAEQVKYAAASGALLPGESLPGIRPLAERLEVNRNTVAKAYRFLERDSVIQTKGYRGTFIHPDARINSTVDLNPWVMSQLSEVIEAFREAGVTDSEIRIAFGNVMNNRTN